MLHNRRIKYYSLLFSLVFIFPLLSVSAETIVITTQEDFEEAIAKTGLDTSSNPGSLTINSYTPSNDPAQDARSLAFLTQDKATLDDRFAFILEAYFPTVDYYDFSEITQLSDLDAYDIVFTYASTFSYAENVPQDIVEEFAENGGTVIQHMVDYQYARQEDVYGSSENLNALIDSGNNYDLVDMTWDGSYIWAVEYIVDSSTNVIKKINKDTGAIVSTCDSPANGVRGIEYADEKLYVMANANDKIYEISTTDCSAQDAGSVLPAGFDFPTGLTNDGTYFWANESTDDQIIRFQLNPGGEVTSQGFYNAPYDPDDATTNRLPRGLGFDGTNVWLVDNGTELAYKIDQTATPGTIAAPASDPTVGYVDQLFEPGGGEGEPYGIAFISGDMWMLDNGAAQDYVFSNSSYMLSKTQYEYYARGNISHDVSGYNVEDIAYDGTYIWAIDQTYNTLHQINISTGAEVDTILAPCTQPRGLAYDGGYLFLACDGDAAKSGADELYKINAATGSVDSQCNVNVVAPNYPQGLAHDSTNLWLGNSGSDKIYKINPAFAGGDCTVITSFNAPGGVTRGLAYDDGYLWAADETDGLYYRLDPSDGSQVGSRHDMEISSNGLTFVDGELWSSDDWSDKIYDIESSTLCRTKFDAPGFNPQGLAYDGTNIWHVDSGTDQLYKLDLSNGSIVSQYAALDSSPVDLTWDGTYLWMTGSNTDKIYKIDPSDGTEVASFASPSTSPSGIVWDGTNLWTADNAEDEFYKISTADGTVQDTFNTPSGETRGMAWDGSYIWIQDYDERAYYRIIPSDDDEGSIMEARASFSSAEQGIEFISDNIWSVDSYTDRFYDQSSALDEPDFLIAEDDNQYTNPWDSGDSFYMAHKLSDEDDTYIQRRLKNVPTAATREVLATSSRSGAGFIHEEVGDGHLFAIDLLFMNKNYETKRTAFPGDSLILNALGLDINPWGVHYNARPVYSELLAEIDTLVSNNPDVVTKEVEGQSSNDEDIISVNFGTEGKPMILFVSGVHGNEEHAYIAEINYIQKLVDLYNANDAVALNLFRNFHIKFIPLVNTYGIDNLVRRNTNNVDINRNFDYNWYADSHGWYGTSAFSEAESQVLRDVVLNEDNNVIYVNDAHTSKSIPPSFTWGYAMASEPDYINDIYDIFTGQTDYRWYEEKSGLGRWLQYDRYQRHTYSSPYFTNWVSDQNIPAATNEVLSKKDVATHRYVHTSSWYITHFHSISKAFSYKIGEAVYCIDTADGASFDNVTPDASLPSGSSLAYYYASSADSGEPSIWYVDYGQVPEQRYLFVKIKAEKEKFDGSSPSLNSLSITYSKEDNLSLSYDPEPGTYYQSVDLTLASDSCSSIYYTTDGTDPDQDSALYNSSITISESTVVKAICYQDSASSDIYSLEYIIKDPHHIPLEVKTTKSKKGIIKIFDKENGQRIVRIVAFEKGGVKAKIIQRKNKKYVAAIKYKKGKYMKIFEISSGDKLKTKKIGNKHKWKIKAANIYRRQNKQEILISRLDKDKPNFIIKVFNYNAYNNKLKKKCVFQTSDSLSQMIAQGYKVVVSEKTKAIRIKSKKDNKTRIRLRYLKSCPNIYDLQP